MASATIATGCAALPAAAQYGTPQIIAEPERSTPRATSPSRLRAGRAPDRQPRSLIPERADSDPRAITRPSSEADRVWRRTRTTPRLDAPAQPRAAAPLLRDPPRYGAGGRRRNVPGRPDTRDVIGDARRLYPRADPLARPSPGVVRTDGARRINQLAPR